MIRVLFIYCLLVGPALTQSFAQNRLLQGEVTEQNTGRPLPGIELSSFGTKDISDDFGVFQLEFRNKKPGDKIQLWVRDPKGRLMVINKRQVEALRLPYRADEGIRIVMADQDHFFESQQRFYGIILGSSRESAESQRKKLYQELKEANQNLGEYERLLGRIKQLEIATSQIEQRAEELATYLASIDLSQASELQKEALSFVEIGEIDSALWVLDEQKLEAAYAESARQKAEAIKSIQQIIASYSLQAEIYLSRGQLDSAANRWIKIAQLREESLPDPASEIALAYIRAGTLQLEVSQNEKGQELIEGAAKSLSEKSLIQDSIYSVACLEIADAWVTLDKLEYAQEYLLKAIHWQEETLGEHHPTLGHSLVKLGKVQLEENQISPAIKNLEQAQEIFSLYPSGFKEEIKKIKDSLCSVYYTSAINLSIKGKFEAALSPISNALKLQPEKGELLILRGRIHRNLDQHVEARDLFQQAADLDPLYAGGAIQGDLGICALREGNWRKAKENFEKFIEKGGRASLANYHEVLYWAYQNKIKKAVEGLERIGDIKGLEYVDLNFDSRLLKFRKTKAYQKKL